MTVQNGTANKLLWAMVSALAAFVLFLLGFAVNDAMARITDNSQRVHASEARLATVEALLPEMKAQLNRIEAKMDKHGGERP